MKAKTVILGGVPIGDEHPVRIAMEIGTYFDNDLDVAKEYIDFGKEVGVDFLKTEICHTSLVIHDPDFTITYNTDSGPKTESYQALFNRKKLAFADYEKLFAYSARKDLPVIASVYDMEGVDFLVSMKAAAAKVATQNNTNRPLIEYCAKKGLPLIIDTGNAFFNEIATSVFWAEAAGIKGIVLNHRPDGSPTPPEEHNMRIIRSHADAFGWPVGLSCHSNRDEMIYLSIGMGARLIEKPVYHKKKMDDIDTTFVLYYDYFREMVKKIRNCSNALGDGVRRKQVPYQLQCRPCIVALKAIRKGDTLSFKNVHFAWPMRGIQAQYWNDIDGFVAIRDIKEGEPLQWGDAVRNVGKNVER